MHQLALSCETSRTSVMDIKAKLETVTNHTCLLGEGPVWDEVGQKILWIDILEGEVHQYFTLDNRHIKFKLGQMVGAIALDESGGLIGAVRNGFAKVNIETESVEEVNTVEAHLIENRFNDGKCDPAGRFWAGSMSMTGNECTGNLYSLEEDLSVTPKLKGIGCSNGLAWSLDYSTFYFIDTSTQQVMAFDYNIKDGSISNPQLVIQIPKEEGYPDGMTIDTEGMLWIAIWNGWKVMRWNPYNGKLMDSFFLPVSKVTSCTFGGPTLEDLYITSAKTGLSENELEEQPLAGSLFVINQCGYKGLNAFRYREGRGREV